MFSASSRDAASSTKRISRDAMREVRMALLDADVNYKVAKDFVAKVSEKAVGEKVMDSLTPCAAGHRHSSP